MTTATISPGRAVSFARRVVYEKSEVFEICAALALAEALLNRLGRPADAARMADVFEMAEGALTRRSPSRGPGVVSPPARAS